MRLDLPTLIIVSTGAFFYWTMSGFNGTFNDYMSRYYDTDNKYDKNFWTGLGLFVVLAIIVYGVVIK
jgi:hypothetical protein